MYLCISCLLRLILDQQERLREAGVVAAGGAVAELEDT